jgi:2-succinyl-6-hydroxy-2,4-cyclohexadiene-1-carboxylate synthase
MKDQRINIGEIELNIRDYQHEGEAIIFLHYGGGNLMMWQPVVPYFQEKYHLILFDLRGHGKSDKPRQGYHIDQMADDVVAVMEKLQIGQAHLIGSSMGAEISLSMAANYPKKVLSLVLDGALSSEFGPYGTWEGSEAEFKEHVAQIMEKMRSAPPKTYPSVDALVEKTKEMFAETGWWNDTFEAVTRHDATKIGEGKYTTSWGIVAEDYMGNYFFYRFEDYYKKIKCPVLMLPDTVHGLDQREKAAMEGMYKLVDRGKIVEVPRWIHPYGWMITPKEVSKAVWEFFDEVSN